MPMRPEDWPTVKRLFDEVRTLSAESRSAYLVRACGDNAAVRAEVESLLSSYTRAGEFLEAPAAQGLSALPSAGLLAGRRLGPYELTATVGAGGMGEVYKALDTRLGRTVAVKVLPAGMADDPLAHGRFEREARAVAALNHPHICTLYDVGSLEGIDFLVMEYLEGETVASRVTKGALPVPQALEYASQIVSALDRAHRAGIVHRDLKPGNIMLTRTGAKLLDFGLAKAAEPHATFAGTTGAPDLTLPGIIIGTAQYMAPEQLDGKAADSRTDIFAFGSVLYEMLTGRKAFEAPSGATLIAAILASHPARPSEVQPGVSPALDYVIARCLEKDPDDRWQTARDLLAELNRTIADLAVGRTSPARRASGSTRRNPAAWIAAAAAIAAVALGALALQPSPPGQVQWLSILPPPGGFDLSPDPAVSPDGRYVVYKAQDGSHRTHLWLKPLDAPAASPIPGTDGTEATGGPFWSPDSRSIGFFAQGKLKRVDIDGSAAQVLAPAPEPRGGTWSPSDVIIFNADAQNLMRVAASGGRPSPLTDASRAVRLFPHALPDGRRYLFYSGNFNGQGPGIFAASLDSSDVRRISDARSPAAYASGFLVFGRPGSLFAQPFDVDRLAVTGEPRQLADGLGVGYGSPLSYPFSISQHGEVATYWTRTATPSTQLTWFDRAGARLSTAGEPAVHAGFTLDASGRRAALERRDPESNTIDIWLLDPTNRGGGVRLTSNGRFFGPVMSPDGTRLLAMERGRGIVDMALAGKGEPEVVVPGPSSKWPNAWSSDGRAIAFTDAMPNGWRLWTSMVRPPGEPRLYREGQMALAAITFSPDRRHVAYMSDESGRFEIYVDAYPDPQHRLRVSTEGGGWPKWRMDGRELYYLAPDRKLMAVDVTVAATGLTISLPEVLFEGPGVNPDTSRTQFEPWSDGSRFLFNAQVDDPTPVGLTVITNWTALLRK